MAFQKGLSFEADQTISLGGINKKTGKPNPTQVEGYFLRTKAVPDKKKKSGYSYIHLFQTAKGNVDVWGKTHMDNQMVNYTPGTMLRVTQAGTRTTPNGEMFLYEIEFDPSNTIEVAVQATTTVAHAEEGEEYVEVAEDEVEEPFIAPAKAPKVAAKAPTSAMQAQIQAALLKNKSKAL